MKKYFLFLPIPIRKQLWVELQYKLAWSLDPPNIAQQPSFNSQSTIKKDKILYMPYSFYLTVKIVAKKSYSSSLIFDIDLYSYKLHRFNTYIHIKAMLDHPI